MNPTASVSERAVKDTIKQFGGQLTVGVFAVAFSAWLNRMLPASELAVWPICLSLGGVVAALSSFGVGDTFVRRVPAMLARGQRDEASGLLKTGLIINLLACALLSVAVYLLADQAARYLLHDVKTTPLVQDMALAAFFLAFAERLNWAMQAVQQFGRRAVINVVTGVMRTPLMVALYLLLGGARGVIVALTITPLVGSALSLIALWPHLFASSRFASPRQLISFSLPYYGVSMMSLVAGRMNQLVIALFVTPAVLSTYFVAASIIGYVKALDRFAIDATAPKLAEKGAVHDNLGQTERVFTKCTRYIALGLLPVHIMVALAATPLLQLYGGAKYAGAGLVLIVLSLAAFFELLSDLHRSHIQVFAKPAHLFHLSIIYSVGNLGLLVLLVPPFGALGAALAEGGLALLQTGASALLLRRTMRLVYDLTALRTAALGTVLAGLTLWALHPLWGSHASPVLAGLLLAGLAYGLGLGRSLKQHDLDLFLRCLPWRLADVGFGAALARGLQWLWVGPQRRAVS